MASPPTHGRPRQETDDPLATQVVRHFPHGLLVVDRDGAVVAANAEARILLGRQPDGDLGEATCCELFGCGREGLLADLCITEIAMECGEQLPEMRVDLPGERSAVWITAARLGSHDRVVLEVRRGDPRDRRRRTEPHWSGSAELRIAALGRTRVESREGPIGGAWLEQRAGQLLKFLVCERHRAVPGDAIAAALWPRAGRRGIGSVRQSVHELRSRLEPARPPRAPSSFVVSRQGGYAFDRTRVRIDVDEFERHIEAGLAADSAGDHAFALKELREGLALYEGDLFAEDPYADWAALERDRVRDLAVSALRVSGERSLREGQLGVAALHFRRLAEIEPHDAATHRRLIEICLSEGRHSEAHRRYTALRARMMRDFGESLDFELRDLAHPQWAQARLD